MERLFSVLLAAALAFAGTQASAQSPSPWSLANTSALVTLAPGGTATAGFVVSGPSGTSGVPVLVRVVGPSLSLFGIKNPAPLPQLRLFDAKGNSGNSIIVIGAVDWTATFASVGAFPLPGGELADGAVGLYALTPGAYTAQASDRSGTGGAILIEVYLNVKVSTIPGGPT